MRSRLLAGVIGLLGILSGCGGVTSSPTAAPSTSSSPTSYPAPTGVPSLLKADLVEHLRVEEMEGRKWFHPRAMTIVCDLGAALSLVDPPPTAVDCSPYLDGPVALGLAAIETVVDDPIDRLYLQGPSCPATGCTDDDVQTVTVVGWSQGRPYSTVIDTRTATVPIPAADDSIDWPTFEQSNPPATRRPTIRNAPIEIAEREPYPFCGRVDDRANPPAVMACFRDAVLAGRPAEMILNGTGAEGGDYLRLYRFSGRGAIVSYAREQDNWGHRQVGYMSLDGEPPHWSFLGR